MDGMLDDGGRLGRQSTAATITSHAQCKVRQHMQHAGRNIMIVAMTAKEWLEV
jgi:hypothetical protein